MAKKIIFKTMKDDWLDNVGDDQYIELSECIGKEIEILKGFCYNSDKYGKGFTFLFKKKSSVNTERTYYTTSFGSAIVRQAEEDILPALKEDSVIVKISEGISRKYKTKYLYFESA